MTGAVRPVLLLLIASLGLAAPSRADAQAPAESPALPEADVADAPPEPAAAPATTTEATTTEASPEPRTPPGGVPEILGPTPPRPPPRTMVPVRPAPPPEPPPPPIPWPTYSVELQVRLGLPPSSSFDEALEAHRYGGVRVVPTSYVGVAFPLPVEWLWLGGRLGVRGRSWDHPERDAASLIAADLLLTAQVRLWIGRVVELGVLFAGGAGWMEVQVHGVGSNQVVGRFGLEATLAFKIDRHLAFGPRIGWDYFQWEGMNAYDHGVDTGGFFLGIGFEGRE